MEDWFLLIRPTVLAPVALVAGLILVVIVVLSPEKPDWLKNLLERMHGDSTTDAPSPDVSKKKKGKRK